MDPPELSWPGFLEHWVPTLSHPAPRGGRSLTLGKSYNRQASALQGKQLAAFVSELYLGPSGCP